MLRLRVIRRATAMPAHISSLEGSRMQRLVQQLDSGALGIEAIVVWVLIALLLAMAGGAIAAIKLAG